jgi:hypothetical protein
MSGENTGTPHSTDATAPTDSKTTTTTTDDTPADLVGQITHRDPAVGLRAVVALRRLLEELERLHVDNARDQGWSWQQIAGSLQVSRQSAHEKHASRRKISGREE